MTNQTTELLPCKPNVLLAVCVDPATAEAYGDRAYIDGHDIELDPFHLTVLEGLMEDGERVVTASYAGLDTWRWTIAQPDPTEGPYGRYFETRVIDVDAMERQVREVQS